MTTPALKNTTYHHIPFNTANQVSVTSGYSWSIGFSVGAGPDGPEGSLSFGYSENHSHTKSTQDFRTLTESVEENSIHFYHQVHIVGGDTIIQDARKLTRGANTPDSNWPPEKWQMFDGRNVREWPSLSMELIKPDCECVWYAQPDTTGEHIMSIIQRQYLNYCFSRSGTPHTFHSMRGNFVNMHVNYDNVNYNDPL